MKLSNQAEDYARDMIDSRCGRLLSNLEEDLRHNPETRLRGVEASYLDCINEIAKVIVDTYKEVYDTSKTELSLEDVPHIIAEISRRGTEAVRDISTSQMDDGISLIVEVFTEDLTLEVKRANLERKIEEERKMKEQQLIETEKRRYQLLKKIFDETNGSSLNFVSMDQLRKEEQLSEEQFYGLTEYLKNEGLVTYPTMGTITITHDGVKEIEASLRDPNKATDHFTPTVIQNIHGNIYGMQTGGYHNTQNVQVNINPDFNAAISKLVELVHGSELDHIKKDDLVEALERLPRLAQQEKTPDVIEAATKRLNLVKAAFDVVKLGAQATPYLQYLYNWFQG
jgi:hypothetical protein